MIEAKIIADSLGPFGDRIITYVLTFPRIVLAEFNTHRALSRNSASSRAIPFKKMLKMVRENPFIPIRWMKEHTGMQGTEYFTHHVEIERLNNAWLNARDGNIEIAKALSEAGATKQITNRLLEPFMWHTCICTGTEFENFFALRAHPDAEIHIQELAYKMLEAANASTPKVLKSYEWHIPFGDNLDMQKTKGFTNEEAGDWQLKVATARCARVSYLNFEGKDDYKEDIRLYERLLKSKHASPFEHVARCMSKEEYEGFRKVEIRNGEKIDEYGWCKNLKGFIQHRALLELETQIDGRVQKSTTK